MSLLKKEKKLEINFRNVFVLIVHTFALIWKYELKLIYFKFLRLMIDKKKIHFTYCVSRKTPIFYNHMIRYCLFNWTDKTKENWSKNIPMISAFPLLHFLSSMQVASKSRHTKYLNIFWTNSKIICLFRWSGYEFVLIQKSTVRFER